MAPTDKPRALQTTPVVRGNQRKHGRELHSTRRGRPSNATWHVAPKTSPWSSRFLEFGTCAKVARIRSGACRAQSGRIRIGRARQVFARGHVGSTAQDDRCAAR